MPQLRCNEDGEWHDFAPEGATRTGWSFWDGAGQVLRGQAVAGPEDGTGLKAGPWFPFLLLWPGARLSDHRVNRPRPVKGAGMKKSLAASAAPTSESAGAAAVDVDESVPLPQKRARHDEAGGSK